MRQRLILILTSILMSISGAPSEQAIQKHIDRKNAYQQQVRWLVYLSCRIHILPMFVPCSRADSFVEPQVSYRVNDSQLNMDLKLKNDRKVQEKRKEQERERREEVAANSYNPFGVL